MNIFQKIRIAIKLNSLIDELTEEVKNMKSWKTTLFGALTAAGVGMANSADPIVKTIGQILSVLGPLLLGLFAKDNAVAQ